MSSIAAAPTTERPAIDLLAWSIAIAALVRLLTLGLYPLADTTEARYAEVARKMVALNDWVTPWYDIGVPFWAKPPLSTWVTAGSFELFGLNEFAARLPHFLGAAFVVWLVWQWLRRRSAREARLAAAILCGTGVFYIAAGAVMTDMMLVVGSVLAMRGFWLGVRGATADERRGNGWLLFIGLAIGLLAKGPIAVVLAGLPIFAWLVACGEWRATWERLPWLRGAALTALLALPWYALAEHRTPGFLDYFIVGEHWKRFTVAGWAGDRYGTAHAFRRGSIWLFAVVACLPWVVLLPWLRRGRSAASVATAVHSSGSSSVTSPVASPIPSPSTSPVTSQKLPAERGWRRYLIFWGLAPCVFFTVSGNVLATYVLPGVPAGAMLAACWLVGDRRTVRVDRVVAGGLLFMALALCGAVAFQNLSGGWKTTKGLVQTFEAARAGGQGLVFFGTPPYSAQFYSRGRAERIDGADALLQRLAKAPAWLAIKADQRGKLPPNLLAGMRAQGRWSGYELYAPAR